MPKRKVPSISLSRQDGVNAILLGDVKVGKTALAQGLAGKSYDKNIQPTASAAFIQIRYDALSFKIALWDTSGNPLLKPVIQSICKDKDIIILAFDITNIDSFISLRKYIEWVKHVHSHPKWLLVATKCDSSICAVDRVFVRQMEKELSTRCVYASAASGKNMRRVIEEVYHLHYSSVLDRVMRKNIEAAKPKPVPFARRYWKWILGLTMIGIIVAAIMAGLLSLIHFAVTGAATIAILASPMAATTNHVGMMIGMVITGLLAGLLCGLRQYWQCLKPSSIKCMTTHHSTEMVFNQLGVSSVQYNYDGSPNTLVTSHSREPVDKRTRTLSPIPIDVTSRKIRPF